LIERINKIYPSKIYITGSVNDNEEISFIKGKLKIPVAYFLDHSISEIAALISKSDLFISNDTGIMHVAGATDVPQVSIFGPTNPFQWAPIGEKKIFVKKSDFIDDVSVEDVFEACNILLGKIPVFH
jgi:heptosyltransferase-2